MKSLILAVALAALPAHAEEGSRAEQEQALRAASVDELIARGRASLPGLGVYRVQLDAQERVGKKLQPPQTMQLWIREKPFAVRVQYVKGHAVGRKALYNTELRTDDLRVRESGFLGIAGAMWIGINNSLVFRDTNHAITDVGFGALLRLQAQDMDRSKPFGGYVRTDEGWNERGRWCIRYDAPPKAVGLYAQRSHICLDPATYLPVEMTNWDARGLLETYVFTGLEPQADRGEVFALKSAGL
jgi:hypothetical protein